jgi:hypothetical protein
MALSEYVLKKFGRKTRAVINPVTASCGITATELLKNNPDRLAWTLINLGATGLYIAWDAGVSATHGIYVGPNGGAVSLIADDDGETTGYQVYGIALVGADAIFVLETEGE